MKLYADAVTVRTRQILGDVLVLVLAWVAGPPGVAAAHPDPRVPLGRRTGRVGRAERRPRRRGGRRCAPGAALVGDAVAAPFRSVADAGRDLSLAGTDAASAIDGLGVFLPLLLVGLVLGFVLFRYLPDRILWIRDASEVRRVLATPHGEQLLAHRAAANRPLRALLAATPDPAGALAQGDHGPLAGVELQALGLRSPLRPDPTSP